MLPVRGASLDLDVLAHQAEFVAWRDGSAGAWQWFMSGMCYSMSSTLNVTVGQLVLSRPIVLLMIRHVLKRRLIGVGPLLSV